MENKKIKSDEVIDHLLTKVPKVSVDDKVSQVFDLLRNNSRWDTVNYIYVLDQLNKLVGVASIKELLRAKDSKLIKDIMVKNPVGVSASVHQERAAVIAIEKNIKAVPIFRTGTREFLGVVGTDDILGLLHQDHVEDLLRFSGIAKHHPTVDIFKAKPAALFKLRIPWLLIGLVGGMLASALVSKFEPTLSKEIALTFFIPVVVYISNAISIQTQALLIRLLASRQVKSWNFLKKEIFVSFFLALTASLVISIYAGMWLGSATVALIVGLAILTSTLVAVTISVAIPLALYKAKKDPALGSGPFSTAVQDISTLVIYLMIATLILF